MRAGMRFCECRGRLILAVHVWCVAVAAAVCVFPGHTSCAWLLQRPCPRPSSLCVPFFAWSAGGSGAHLQQAGRNGVLHLSSLCLPFLCVVVGWLVARMCCLSGDGSGSGTQRAGRQEWNTTPSPSCLQMPKALLGMRTTHTVRFCLS